MLYKCALVRAHQHCRVDVRNAVVDCGLFVVPCGSSWFSHFAWVGVMVTCSWWYDMDLEPNLFYKVQRKIGSVDYVIMSV